MSSTYLNNWHLFTVAFGLLLLVALVMIYQSRYFYTQDVVARRFSIMELQLSATAMELYNLVNGLYALPASQAKKSIRALKGQLVVDFLFMPFVYGNIFLLCGRVAQKMPSYSGYIVFMILGIMQVVPWICDIIENIYLLQKIRKNTSLTSDTVHKNYLIMEAVKWILILMASICSVSAVAYFWLSGNFSTASFKSFMIVLVEVMAFGIAYTILLKSKKSEKHL